MASSALTLACAAGFATALLGCGGTERRDAGWTVERAEAVTTIRGLAVRVVRCQGLGPSDEGESGTRHYRRFACEAGARRRGESYDTVAIHYQIHVLASGGYVLDSVRFIGPGVP